MSVIDFVDPVVISTDALNTKMLLSKVEMLRQKVIGRMWTVDSGGESGEGRKNYWKIS